MRQLPRFLPVVALIGALFVPALAEPAGATPVVVNGEGQYRAALTVLSGDTTGPHTITLGADITITGATDPTYTGSQPLTIDGAGRTLSGGDTRRVLVGNSASDPRLTLDDVIVRDGFTTGSGGAVDWEGPVDVVDSQLLDNVASGPGVSGGALVVEGDVTITGSTITGNSATSSASNAQGGAVQLSPGAWDMTVTDSTVSDNTATGTASVSGGALRAIGNIDLTDVVVHGNTAAAGTEANGGAVSSSAVVTVLRGEFVDNVADGTTGASGGALVSADGMTVTDSTFTRNTGDAAVVFGSALMNVFNEPLALTNTTIIGNLAIGADGQGAVWAGGDLSGTNVTIIGNNGSGQANVRAVSFDGRGFVIGQPGAGGANCLVTNPSAAVNSVDDDGSCMTAGAGSNANLPDVASIRFGAPRDNGGEPATVLPLAGSPAIDLMAGGCPVPLDPRGVARPFGAACDAGAIEAVYPAHPFTDVASWVEDAVRWMASDAHDPPFMTGITPTTFEGGDPITRAQVARMLYREEGAPDVSSTPDHPFTDVPAWVDDAVTWAYDEGIVTGVTPTTFVPNDPITRAQVVRMKYRFAGSPSVTGYPAHPFTDVPAWVEEAVTWAANTDFPLPLVTGITPTTFEPSDDITRNQVARMDWRLGITPEAWEDTGDAPYTMPFRTPPA